MDNYTERDVLQDMLLRHAHVAIRAWVHASKGQRHLPKAADLGS